MSIPTYRLIKPQVNRCFVFKWEEFDLTTHWHYHPEIELIYFIKGKTSAVIGERFYEFDAGDLVLLGEDFPHVLKQHPQYFQEYPDEKPFGLIIQFTRDFLGKDFFDVVELQPIKNLLSKAKRGLMFSKKVEKDLSSILLNMHLMDDMQKLLTLLYVLSKLSATKEFTYLTSEDYINKRSYDEDRMQSINSYVFEHFKEPITIKEIAEVSNMTETSFCRYFKTRTLKTFVRFLNEVRVSYACRLLNNEKYSITDACFESGFNSLSYFNRQFKQITKMSPMQYRQWKTDITKEKEKETF